MPEARVVELVDTRDLKSLDRNIVPVQVRPRAPFKNLVWYKISEDNETAKHRKNKSKKN